MWGLFPILVLEPKEQQLPRMRGHVMGRLDVSGCASLMASYSKVPIVILPLLAPSMRLVARLKGNLPRLCKPLPFGGIRDPRSLSKSFF